MGMLYELRAAREGLEERETKEYLDRLDELRILSGKFSQELNMKNLTISEIEAKIRAKLVKEEIT